MLGKELSCPQEPNSLWVVWNPGMNLVSVLDSCHRPQGDLEQLTSPSGRQFLHSAQGSHWTLRQQTLGSDWFRVESQDPSSATQEL